MAEILLIKLGALGDVVRTTCVLNGLNEKYPGVNITWVTLPNHVEVLKNVPFIKEIVPLTEDGKNHIKSKIFDIVINFDEDKESCSLATENSKEDLSKIYGFYFENGQIKCSPSAKEYFDMSLLGEKPMNDVLKKNNTKTYQRLMLDILQINPKNWNILYNINSEQKIFANKFKIKQNIRENQKIDAPPPTKVGGLIGARFLDVSKTSVFEHLEIQVNFSARNFFLKRNFCTEVCHCEQTSCDRSADHIRKNVVLGRHCRHDKVIGINTGAGDRWPSKRLSIRKTINLINLLSERTNSKIILFGGPGERERNKEILENTAIKIIDSGCENSISQFAALIDVCDVLITTDTAALHFALGLDKKVIALIGPTSSAEIELYDRGDKIIPNHDCVCCYKPDCVCMDFLDENVVCTKAMSYL